MFPRSINCNNSRTLSLMHSEIYSEGSLNWIEASINVSDHGGPIFFRNTKTTAVATPES